MAEPVGTLGRSRVKEALKVAIQVSGVLCVNDGHSTPPYPLVGVMDLLHSLRKEAFSLMAIIHPSVFVNKT